MNDEWLESVPVGCLQAVLWVFGGVLVGRGWVRPGLPCLPLVFGPIQHCTSAVPDAWRDSVSADLCCSKGFRSTLFWDYQGSMQLLNSFHVRDRDEALLRGFLSGSVGDGFLLGHINGDEVPCRFCGGPDGHGQKFWDRTYPPLVHVRESPEFLDLVRADKAAWAEVPLVAWLASCLVQ